MRPMTTADIGTSTSLNPFFEPESLNDEDCRYLLRALEKQAFEQVLFAFRAQGPLTQYKQLLLQHIKSALFITENEYIAKVRIAANNPYLTRIAEQLNPSYDNFSEWLAAGVDFAGVELARIRKQSMGRQSAHFAEQTSQIMREIHKHNRNLGDYEGFTQLFQLPKKPYVPERLRRFLQETETGDIASRVDISLDEVAGPSARNVRTAAANHRSKRPVRNGVGRPKKYQTEQLKPQPSVVEFKRQNSSSSSAAHQQQTTVPNKSATMTTTAKLTTVPVENNRKRPYAKKGPGNSPEEQAVLAILARTSAQLSREAAEREEQQQLQMQQKQQQQQQQQMASTSTAAMESLAEAALAQAQELSHQHQMAKVTLPINNSNNNCPSSNGLSDLGTLLLQQSAALATARNQHMETTVEEVAAGHATTNNYSNNKSNGVPMFGYKENSNSLTKPMPMKKKRTGKKTGINTCARVRPFLFEETPPGMPKPPRGNPDKRFVDHRGGSQLDDRVMDDPPLPIKRGRLLTHLPKATNDNKDDIGSGGGGVGTFSGSSAANVPLSHAYYPQFHPNSAFFGQQQQQTRLMKQTIDVGGPPPKHAHQHQQQLTGHEFVPTENNTIVIDMQKSCAYSESIHSSSIITLPNSSLPITASRLSSLPSFSSSTDFRVNDHSYEKGNNHNNNSISAAVFTPLTTTAAAIPQQQIIHQALGSPPPLIDAMIDSGPSTCSSSPAALIILNTMGRNGPPPILQPQQQQKSPLMNHQQPLFVHQNGLSGGRAATSSSAIASTSTTTAFPMTTEQQQEGNGGISSAFSATTSMPKTTSIEASGLDFLASTASLLAPIETTTAPKNNLQQQQKRHVNSE